MVLSLLLGRSQSIRRLHTPKHTQRRCPWGRDAGGSLGKRGVRNSRDWSECFGTRSSEIAVSGGWYLGTGLAVWGQEQPWSEMGGEALKVFLLSGKNFHIEMLFCSISLQWLTTGLFSWFCTTFFLYQKMMTKEVRSLWDSEQQNQDSKGFYQVGKERFVLSGTNMNFDNVSCTWVDLGYLIDCKLRNESAVWKGFQKVKMVGFI